MSSEEAQYRAIPAPPYMEIMQPPSQQQDHDDAVSEYHAADDMTVNTMRTTNTMDESTARRKYGLKNWRKYALYKHGNNPKFLNSTQGREILKANFRNEVKGDLESLSRWVDAVDAAAAAMEQELHETRVENAALLDKVADTERLLGLQEQMVDSGHAHASDPSKIQYVVLLEKKLSVATWETEELRAEVAALKQTKNNDAVVSKLKMQLESVTRQRDELLSERGTKSREIEERERSLIIQLEELSRARAEIAEECSRVQSDSATRVETLFAKLEVVQRQRDDLLNEQRMWRREKEEMTENLLLQMNDLNRQKEQLTAENLQLRTQIVHLTPINVEAGASSRFKAAPASLHSGAAVKKTEPAVMAKTHGDAVPERKPPSASLKSKLEEWNKQRDRMAEEQQAIREQEAAAENKGASTGSSKSSVQSVLSAISPSSILGSVKKLASGSEKESPAPSNAIPTPPQKTIQAKPSSPIEPITRKESASVPEKIHSSPVAAPTMEAAKDRISEILAADSDDEDLAISAALSRATNLVEEVRGGSSMSK